MIKIMLKKCVINIRDSEVTCEPSGACAVPDESEVKNYVSVVLPDEVNAMFYVLDNNPDAVVLYSDWEADKRNPDLFVKRKGTVL